MREKEQLLICGREELQTQASEALSLEGSKKWFRFAKEKIGQSQIIDLQYEDFLVFFLADSLITMFFPLPNPPPR